MPRKAFIFGNGLGMALDPQRFSLRRAMMEVWNSPHLLDENQKNLISQTLGGDGAIPQDEDQLDTLHQVVTACKTLNKISGRDIHWLSELGQQFPYAVANYLHKVAAHLHLHTETLPEEFSSSLIEYIRRTNSHVATLNYDKLLYDAFLDANILNGFDGSLVDGVTTLGFSPENLERRYQRNFGYYLHLHGSPLYYDEHGVTYKHQRNQLDMHSHNGSEHIVLTHVAHKKSVIAASRILSTYWTYLQRALSESTEIYLVGYSGNDSHLNEIISLHGTNKTVKIIEWHGNFTENEKHAYWNSKLRCQFLHYHCDNILEFNHWQNMNRT
ncbi:SIR2 family protein [Pseudomonas sp. 30_B]|uniref:SIR2 family protein n=1 Tax=Pseudomonas sp. 30_B TaxID=2813575 RepID=UPI001A9D9DED|nr:SIR2 family protein [Pseudomonas sp. 30_B]